MSGEAFPIVLADGIALIGQDRDSVCIGDIDDTLVRITCADCSVRRLCIEHAYVIAIQVRGSADRARVESLRTTGGCAVVIEGAEDTIVRDCQLVGSPKCPRGCGIRMTGGDAGTVIRGCTMEGFDWAAYVDSSSNALIEDCIFGFNYHDIYLCYNDDPLGSPNPDLGGGARAGAGRSDFGSFKRTWHPADCEPGCRLTNLTTNTIFARNNTWSAYPPVEGTDFCNPNGGQVIW